MTGIVWLDAREIRAVHLELLTEHCGMPGIRDEGLLESALARARNLAAYGTPSLTELAGAYGFGLAKNHAFVDGNKRIALAAIAIFLDVNGHELVASQSDAVEIILAVAASQISEAELASWIGRNSRKIDLQDPLS